MIRVLKWLGDSFVPLLSVGFACGVLLIWAQIRTNHRAQAELVIPVTAAAEELTRVGEALLVRSSVMTEPERWPGDRPETPDGLVELLQQARLNPQEPGLWAEVIAAYLSAGRAVEARGVKVQITNALGYSRHRTPYFNELVAWFTPAGGSPPDGLWALLFNLGLAHQELGELRAAKLAYDAANRLPDPGWRSLVASADLQLPEDREAAREKLAQALARAPAEELIQVRLVVGNAWLRVEEPAEALAAYRVDPTGDHESLQHNSAVAASAVGNQTLAEDLFRAVLATNPNHGGAHYNYARLLEDMERFEAALDHYRQAMFFAPEFAPARLGFGRLLLRIGQTDRAAEQFRWLYQHFPGAAEHALALGRMRMRQGDLRAASQLIQEAIAKKGGHYPEAELELGSVYHTARDLPRAEQAFAAALAQGSDRAEASYRLGSLLAARGAHRRALNAFAQARAAGRDDALLWAELAQSHNALGHQHEAIRAYRQLLNLQPNAPDGLAALGSLLSAKGQVDEAITLYRRAVELDAGRAQTWLDLGDAERRRRNNLKAVMAYQRAAEAAQREEDTALRTKAYRALALLHQNRREFQEAYEAFRHVLLQQPTDTQARFGMAHALVKLGQRERASNELRKLLAMDPNHREGKELAAVLDREAEAGVGVGVTQP